MIDIKTREFETNGLKKEKGKNWREWAYIFTKGQSAKKNKKSKSKRRKVEGSQIARRKNGS